MTTLSWRRAISKAGQEFKLSKLRVLEGTIPKSLNGSLYRNGPARLQRGGQPMGHWFDGDGAILGVHLKDGEARAAYRYVQTQAYQEEELANKLLYANFGMSMPGTLWKKLRGIKHKNSANTSVLKLHDKILALCEGGWPHALTLETLETIGLDNLGFLTENQTYSAHPKVDYETGEIYNIGAIHGRNNFLCLSRLDKHGKLIAQTKVPHRVNMIHDFVLAGKYAVVMSFPTEFKGLLSFVLGLKAFNDGLQWVPELGTEVFVFDRNDLSLVSQFKTEPFYAFHYTNGYEDKDGTLYLELVKHNSYPEITSAIGKIPDLSEPLSNSLKGKLSYMRINPKQGKMIEFKDMAGEKVEFPTVADANIGKRWRYSLVSTTTTKNPVSEEFFTATGRYDYNTQQMQVFDYGQDKYASEPILVSSEGDPEQGNILTVVYDAKDNKSELWVHDSQNLEKDPLCRIALPEVIPPGFHGRWYNRT